MKDKLITVAVLCLVVGYGAGYVVADRSEDSTDTHNTHQNNHGSHMKHEMFMIDAEQAPSVSLTVTEDAKSGWNIQIDTEDFEFTPQDVNGDNVVGEGHAHLYVDGAKIARIYSNNFHYPENFDGTKEFRVTLNANDHGEYAVDGQVIEASVSITHDHDADDSAHTNGSDSAEPDDSSNMMDHRAM